MARATIDFGIDLGTTNSAIAVLRGTTPDVVKNNLENDITPSAFFIGKRQQRVGLRAKNEMEKTESAGDVYTEFKRKMGTDYKYSFKTAGRVMRPEELSAEVLKSLRGDVQQRLGEDPQAAVITVPAAFEQRQCVATSRAGELAGLLQCPLLQEPVAAALAYGFRAEVTKEYWLVYDFGGGTFDAAIMRAEDGSISVVNNGGNNYLGGSDIDWAIIEQLIIPELIGNYNLPNFERGNKRWDTALARIKRATEDAKIELSRRDRTYLECRITDRDGKEIEVDFELTRDALIGVAEPFIMQSVEICKRVLKEKNLSPHAIEKVILVGGPTLAPYFREILHSNLGIALEHHVDPLTVVARGAAVFAGTQRVEAAQKAVKGQFTVTLSYKPMGPDTDPRIAGKVSSTEGSSVNGFTIELVNRSEGAKDLIGWRSGKVTLKTDGIFQITLKAEKGIRNTYGIELLDREGGKQSPVPDALVYTVTGGAGVITDVPNTNSIAVALANNVADVFFEKGAPLPAKRTTIYHSTHALKKGESGSVLTVPVVEGEIEMADRNRLAGALLIRGTNIRRDLPAGSEVEVTLHMDKSRLIRVKAYIPMLDEEYEAVIVSHEKSPDPNQLQREFDGELSRLKALQQKADEAHSELAESLLDEVSDSEALDGLEDLIGKAKGERDSAEKAEQRLLEMKVKLDQAENALRWPALVAEANEELDKLDELIDQDGTPEQQEKAEKLREQVEELISERRAERLRRKIEQITDLQYEILFSQPGFWVGYFNYLMDMREKMSDQDMAESLLDKGQQCIDRGAVQGLRSVVAQLLDLLPREVAEAAQRGYQSSLLK